MTAPVDAGSIIEDMKSVFSAIGLVADQPACRSDEPLSTLSYVIAMLPRTGSTALCSLMTQTGQLGYPEEYTNPRGPLQHWATRLAARDIVEYFDIIRRERATPNGVFGMKTTYDDFKPLVDGAAVSTLLGDVRFIYLTRRDFVAQAISEYIAEESGIWHRDRAMNVVHSAPIADPVDVDYNEQRIVDIIDRLTRMQQAWERFFVLYSVVPLRITYEEFCAGSPALIRRTAAYLGVEINADLCTATAETSRMADDRNVEWAARFRSRFVL
jgi:LPS sulfotransferase NodH